MLFLVCMESLIKGGDSLCPYILSQLLQLLYITLQTTCHNKLFKNMFFNIWSFYPFHSHFQKELFSFDNAWLNWPLYKWKMEEKKSFLSFCCPVSQILIASAFVNSKRGACDRFQMIFMSVPQEFKRAVPAQQNQPDLIGWDWKKVQIAPTLIDGCNNGWFPTLYSASWLSIDFRHF